MSRSAGTLGIGVVGFGWMGQAHSRSYARLASIFGDDAPATVLTVCADPVEQRRRLASRAFGFESATDDWREVVDSPRVDAVVVTAPNMLHVEIAAAAAAAGKAVFCEKPVGGTPDHTVAAWRATRNVVTGVGYNYRWAPLVQYARELIAGGRLGTITNYRGRFFSSYGNDPLGTLSWRYLVDDGGYGVTSDLLSHAIDLAHFLIGPITEVVGTGETFIRQRPVAAAETHYARGSADDPVGDVTNEDWFGAIARFTNGTLATFETSRAMTGPESQHAFEVYGTEGSLRWTFERMNELEVHLPTGSAHAGYTTVFGGDQFYEHGRFVPGHANAIGFEDLVTIECKHFAQAVVTGSPFEPGFDAAVDYVNVQAALLRSWRSRSWEPVTDLRGTRAREAVAS